MKATEVEQAARAAYRMGLIDAILHPDVKDALAPPAIVIESLKGEAKVRRGELGAVGVEMSALADMRLNYNERVG